MTDLPTGMVDTLAPTPRERTPFELSLLDFVLGTGPIDPALLARIQDPGFVEAAAKATALQRERDWPALGRYRGENAAPAAPPRAVFIGDSITELWPFASPELFADGIIGRGISGQTAPQILLRFHADVVAQHPAAVHILCGTNDIAGNTGPTTPEDYRRHILAMLDIAQANGLRVLLGSIPPAGYFLWQPAVKPAQRILELNDWLRETAAARDAGFVDYHQVLATPDGAMQPHFTNDGVHPNAAGYAAMTPLALAAIEGLGGYRAGQSDDRPWGSWSVIATGPRFAAKRITVKPGASLSLQRHRWRDEHWIVVQGSAEITLGEATRSLAENGAIFIPAGTAHRLANRGPGDLVILEIQYGDRLEEADIERLEDIYGRS